MALDRTTIVRSALNVLNEVGIDGLTLRSIATELGIKPPALYWHFKNKQELLDEMATTVFADASAESPPPDETTPWDEWAVAYARGLRRVLLRYRDGAKAFSGTYLTDEKMFGAMEAALRLLTGAGFTLRQATWGMSTLYSFVVGFVIEEQAVAPWPGERNPQYDLNARAARIDRDRYPLALAAGDEIFGGFDERFDYGLQLVLSGMRQVLDVGKER